MPNVNAAPLVNRQDQVDACALSWAAKVVCSAVFVSGRRPDEALTNSASWILLSRDDLRRTLAGEPIQSVLGVTVEVDDAARSVTLRRPGARPACARMFGDHGAIVVDAPRAELAFPAAPAPPIPEIDTNTLHASSSPANRDDGVALDPNALEGAADLVFEHRAQRPSAFVVVHRGRLVCERYWRPGQEDVRIQGWSMGKTLGTLLAGRSLQLHGGSLDDAALFPEWNDDDRREIRLRDLLQLSSGLEFTGSFGIDEDHSELARDGHFLDHVYIYASGGDAARFCVEKPREHPPGTVGRYRNCDPLLVQRWLRTRLEERGESHLTWPHRALLEPIGARGFLLETDPAENLLISGHVYARARDFAQLGALLLTDGCWQGERLLPPGFTEFVRTPAPAWKGERGAGVVLNQNGQWPLPSDAFWLSGATVNRTIVVPSLELVVVRMGHIAGRVAGEADALARALEMIGKAAGA